jgi:anti-sigma B factor antagonist/stage II sporulation protein AA (anti-sigma F factor antagonist)
MEDFAKEYFSDAVIINVNLTRATLKEAIELKEIIDEELLYGNKNLVLDISECEFIDSTFLGAILVAHKNVIEKDGQLNIVEPENLWVSLLAISRTLEKRSNLPPMRDAFKPTL